MSGPTPFVFTEAEVMGLYMILKDRESELDYTISKLLNRLERHLYGTLTIEELENIEQAYRRRIDAQGRRIDTKGNKG